MEEKAYKEVHLKRWSRERLDEKESVAEKNLEEKAEKEEHLKWWSREK